jgi:hypothetical protein
MSRLRSWTAGAVLTGLMLLGAAVPASAQSAAWSVVPSPNAGVAGSRLEGVSCVSAGACIAVGYFVGSEIDETLIESWDGTSWTGVPSPNPGSASNSNVLNDVSCTSATACMAVGYSWVPGGPDKTLTESWNGSRWTVLPSPNPATVGGNELSGVSCVSATACTAVGYSDIPSPERTLIESWNGTSWSVAPSPSPNGEASLSGVSCVSADACVAVGGSSGPHVVLRTLIESWNGTSWSVAPSPSPGGDPALFSLSGVSCVSADACVAVGNRSSGTLVESWNGTSWSIVPSPNQGGSSNNNALQDVSCTSATACTAVGVSLSGSVTLKTLIESWNGTSWAIEPSPDRGIYTNYLFGVSCLSATACTAAGFSELKNHVNQTLIESEAASS